MVARTNLETLDAVTSADIKAFVNGVLLRDRNRATIIMLPEGVMKRNNNGVAQNRTFC